MRAETPEEFYAAKESDKLDTSPDDSQLNAIHEAAATEATGTGGGGGAGGAAAEKQLKFRQEIHALALEGGDVARGYCSCDEQQWTNSSSPTSTTTSATMSPTPTPTTTATTTTTGSANAKSAGIGNVGSGSGSGNGIVRMAAALKQRNAAGARLKQQHHVRFSDEKNFSD